MFLLFKKGISHCYSKILQEQTFGVFLGGANDSSEPLIVSITPYWLVIQFNLKEM